MRTQAERDEQSVVIATAVGICVLVLAIGGGLLWVSHSLLGWDGAAIDALGVLLIVGAAGAPIGYLVREQRR